MTCRYFHQSDLNNSHLDNESKKQTIDFYKHFFLILITAFEFLFEKYPQFNLFDLEIKGLSQMITSNIDKYEPILEELYKKYKSNIKPVSPETKFLCQLISDTVTFHLTNCIVKNTTNSNINLIGKISRLE